MKLEEVADQTEPHKFFWCEGVRGTLLSAAGLGVVVLRACVSDLSRGREETKGLTRTEVDSPILVIWRWYIFSSIVPAAERNAKRPSALRWPQERVVQGGDALRNR